MTVFDMRDILIENDGTSFLVKKDRDGVSIQVRNDFDGPDDERIYFIPKELAKDLAIAILRRVEEDEVPENQLQLPLQAKKEEFKYLDFDEPLPKAKKK